MTQTARVLSVFEDGTAEVLVTRESACGGNCAQCGGCGGAGKTLTALARNPMGAKPGDNVIIETGSARVLSLAALVYLAPLLLLLGGFLLWGLWAGLAGLLLGLLGAVVTDRLLGRRNRLLHTVTAYAQDPDQTIYRVKNEDKGDNCID